MFNLLLILNAPIWLFKDRRLSRGRGLPSTLVWNAARQGQARNAPPGTERGESVPIPRAPRKVSDPQQGSRRAILCLTFDPEPQYHLDNRASPLHYGRLLDTPDGVLDDGDACVGETKSLGALLGQVQELGRRDDNGRDAPAFELDEVVDTPRRAGSSIGTTRNHHVGLLSQLGEHVVGGREGGVFFEFEWGWRAARVASVSATVLMSRPALGLLLSSTPILAPARVRRAGASVNRGATVAPSGRSPFTTMCVSSHIAPEWLVVHRFQTAGISN